MGWHKGKANHIYIMCIYHIRSYLYRLRTRIASVAWDSSLWIGQTCWLGWGLSSLTLSYLYSRGYVRISRWLLTRVRRPKLRSHLSPVSSEPDFGISKGRPWTKSSPRIGFQRTWDVWRRWRWRWRWRWWRWRGRSWWRRWGYCPAPSPTAPAVALPQLAVDGSTVSSLLQIRNYQLPYHLSWLAGGGNSQKWKKQVLEPPNPDFLRG